MNYLAHLALSPESPALMIGNLLGDFVKGNEAYLQSTIPKELIEGILLHRRIDTFTDQHPAFLHSTSLFSEKRRRYAGIAVDIFYDYFLSVHWNRYYDVSLEKFVHMFYEIVDAQPTWQVGKFGEIYPIMKRERWLERYGNKKDIELALARMDSRMKRTLHPSIMQSCMQELNQHYDVLEQNFLTIYKDLMAFVQAQDIA